MNQQNLLAEDIPDEVFDGYFRVHSARQEEE